MPRTVLLRDWLDRQLASDYPNQTWSLAPASADASFRRYFRLTLPDGLTRVVMDAPPAHEDCRPFVKVAALFRDAGVHVPEVYGEDLAQGFLLLSDLGCTTYLEALEAFDAANAAALYADANAALVAIQRASRAGVLPDYDEALLTRELDLFPDWYVARHLGVSLSASQQATLRAVFAKILANNLAQPRVFVHRDYHSRNLMVCDSDNPGIIDFQDAVYGPITYDLASLYRDAYICWDEAQELDFVIRYWQLARAAGLPVRADFDEFYRDYEWMGAQRQIKVLGIFARLSQRDGKDGYLKDMPTVMAYLRRTCERYLDLRPLARLLDEIEARTPACGLSF